MKILATIVILFSGVLISLAQTATGYGPVQNGYKMGQDNNGVYVVVNNNNVVIAAIDDLSLDTDSIIQQIRNSTVPDRHLIATVLAMHTDSKGKTKELMHTTRTYNEIALLVLTNVEYKLGKIYSEKQLKKMMKKTK